MKQMLLFPNPKIDGESATGDYHDDDKTKSFWDHIFVSDNEMLDAYSKESVGKVNVVVYTSDITEAQNAKKVLDQFGALKIYNKPTVVSENRSQYIRFAR